MKLPNCLPSPTQYLLLKAGLLEKEPAAFAWQNYCKLVDLQNIDHASTNLLPLVYRQFQEIITDEIKVCKSVYRHTWSYNNLQFFKIKKVLNTLSAHSIPATLLKGAAMILGYYKDPGLRVMGDIDIVVPKSQAKTAVELLLSSGWSCVDDITLCGLTSFIQRSHAIQLKNQEGNVIDLHWTVLSETGLDALFASFQYRTRQITTPQCNSTLMCPEDQLLHTLFHGMKYSPVPLIRWIPDSVTLLKQTPNFDWSYFQAQVKALRIELSTSIALSYLNEHFFPIPIPFNYTPTAREKSYYHFSTRAPRKLFIFQTYWHAHVRNAKTNSIPLLLLSLPRFVKKTKNFSYWYQVPLFVLKGLWRLLKPARALSIRSFLG